uniref:trypsin n=1 Tax=Neogobius melanostomus TaxID=47308 RepID=A0A8C6T3Q6_9GOBI
MGIFSLLTLMLACGHVLTSQIYGGREAAAHSRPFMALVVRKLPNESIEYCAGFLLSEWFVMTAAHCEASWYEVYLGLHDFNHPEDAQIIAVDETFPATGYNRTTLSHDLMLLKLNSKVKFNRKVQPIDLADPNDKPPEVCMVFGWGFFKPGSKELSPVLKEANVTLTNIECEEDFYCSKGQSGPGEGDSGCPLVCENEKVYGVVSKGTYPDENGERLYEYSMISNKMGMMH